MSGWCRSTLCVWWLAVIRQKRNRYSPVSGMKEGRAAVRNTSGFFRSLLAIIWRLDLSSIGVLNSGIGNLVLWLERWKKEESGRRTHLSAVGRSGGNDRWIAVGQMNGTGGLLSNESFALWWNVDSKALHYDLLKVVVHLLGNFQNVIAMLCIGMVF